MATRGKVVKLGDTARLYGRFIRRLETLGCIWCPRRNYVYPEHLAHACAQSAVNPETLARAA